jgi:hypothetical protein
MCPPDVMEYWYIITIIKGKVKFGGNLSHQRFNAQKALDKPPRFVLYYPQSSQKRGPPMNSSLRQYFSFFGFAYFSKARGVLQ